MLLSTKMFILLIFIIPCFEAHSGADDTTKIINLYTKAFQKKDSDLKKSFNYLEKALKLSSTTPSMRPATKSDLLSVAGTLHMLIGNFDKSTEFHFMSLSIRDSIKDFRRISNSYLNLANTYYKSGQYTQSIPHYKNSIFNLKKLNNIDPEEYISIYSGMGTSYESQHKMDSALRYYSVALNYLKELPDSNYQSATDLLCNVGKFYLTCQNYPRAIFFLNKAVSIQKKRNDLSGLAWSYNHLAIIYTKQHLFSYAANYLNIALPLANSQSDFEIIKDIYASKMDLFASSGRCDSISFYLDKFIQSNRIVNKKLTKSNLLEAEIKYNTRKKDYELKLNEKEKDLYAKIVIIGSITFLLILFFLIRNYRQKQRISRMQLDLKNREISDLLNQQETASYAAMLEGQDQERLRIARELHDRLGSTLAAVKLGIQGDPTTTYRQNLELVDNAIAEIRAVSHDLSGGNIERYGLLAALTELKHTLERSGNITFDLYMEAMTLPSSLQVPLYRIAQELVSNTLKHANASFITLQINEQQEHLTIIYEDNGRGFNVNNLSPGMGLENIRHRLSKWDGTLEIDSYPGRGTIIIINIPHKTHYHD